jgi:dihydroorotase
MLIRNGHLVDPAQSLDAHLDVRLRGGIVAEIGDHLEPLADEEVFDAQGAFVAPGFIDMHVHLREPGNPEKETVLTGTAAAAAGGFTAVAAMPNTNPAIDTPALVREVLERSSRNDAVARVYPIAAITRGRKGKEILDYAALEDAGAVAFSDDGSTVMDAGVMRGAAIASRARRGALIVHCEDEHVKGDAVMSEGGASARLGLRGSPPVAEDIIVARDLLLAADTGKRWHIAHASTRRAAELVRAAKMHGVPVTCEVTPHHLVFTDDLIERLGSGAKVNPPLRTQSDVDALRAAVREGVIDAFATDHAPHTHAEKTAHVSCGAVGFSGLEVAVGAYAYALPDLPVSRFVELLSTNPARILGVPGGTLAPGAPADLTIFTDRAWTVDPSQFYSQGKSTPFSGMMLPRRAIATILGGKIVMRDGRLLSQVRVS